MNIELEIPYGYCQCGCGQRAPIARKTQLSQGAVAGVPQKFIKGHTGKLHAKISQNTFWDNVDKTPNEKGCWLWMRAKLPQGYGLVRWNGKHSRAHRVAYALAYGEFPQDLDVLHTCDNPSCVNPSHLFLGTNQDNVDDKVKKQRHAHGESNGRHKITKAEAQEIRNRYEEGGISQRELGELYGIAQTSVGKIVRKIHWKE